MAEQTETRRFAYEAKSKSRAEPYLFLAVAIVFVAFGIAGFVFCVTRPPENRVGPFALQLMSTMPFLFALGAFSYAMTLLWTPRRIELSIEGILLQSARKRRVLTWDQIDRVEIDKRITLTPGVEMEVLILRDATGAKRAVLKNTVKNFDDLSQRVQRIVAKRTGHATVNAKARRSKRAASFFLGFGVLFVVIAVSLGVGGWRESTNRRLLKTDGAETTATIDKRYLFNKVNPWIEYTFRDAAGRPFSRRAMLLTKEWEALEGAKTVPVRYVRSNPDYSRVVKGEAAPFENDPKLTLLLAPAGGLFSILFFVVGILRWKNLDIIFDEKKFRFRLKRLDAPAEGSTKH